MSISKEDNKVLKLQQKGRVMEKIISILKEHQVLENIKYKMPGTKRNSKDGVNDEWSDSVKITEPQIQKILHAAIENTKVFSLESNSEIRRHTGSAFKVTNSLIEHAQEGGVEEVEE